MKNRFAYIAFVREVVRVSWNNMPQRDRFSTSLSSYIAEQCCCTASLASWCDSPAITRFAPQRVEGSVYETCVNVMHLCNALKSYANNLLWIWERLSSNRHLPRKLPPIWLSSLRTSSMELTWKKSGWRSIKDSATPTAPQDIHCSRDLFRHVSIMWRRSNIQGFAGLEAQIVGEGCVLEKSCMRCRDNGGVAFLECTIIVRKR